MFRLIALYSTQVGVYLFRLVTARFFFGVSHIPKAILWEQLRGAAAHNFASQEVSTYT